MKLDEFIAVGSEHEQAYGSVVHFGSTYLFWHGYLAWELESRIRNLGGEYACFGLPYWDFSTESLRSETDKPYIFENDIHGLGGNGNPDDFWTVNEFSWPGVETKDFWVPAHCQAEGDEYPVCSLKRSTSKATGPSAAGMGAGIIDNAQFADFSRWYSHTVNLPHNLLIDAEALKEPVVTSYDPIWYIFHSMVSYHEAIWKDCHDYDEISPEELDNSEDAFSTFCDADSCDVGQGLDDPMFYGGLLQTHPWSFVSQQSLTVRKAYHLDRWNVKYDLTGDGFYGKSGLKDYCQGKLNTEWFINADKATQSTDIDMNKEEKILSSGTKGNMIINDIIKNNTVLIAVMFVVIIFGFALLRAFCGNNKNKINDLYAPLNGINAAYGSV
eukprot:CAMPEP_0201564032 /NCGR_PEP_ID=MMETSP0190_2-20130828/1815_1 /ASSEMBLY_ACC=CAM_ASM_000263 /TAXON_ID=37353 /ORGANISM="Rosalina sp." /LENGTH=383 /DNA_ID=CAMNT_0047979627 /DNA_START=276 /DNA_END=1427 /DNA_ORIENTATION=+